MAKMEKCKAENIQINIKEKMRKLQYKNSKMKNR